MRLNQTATYWGPGVRDGFGQIVYPTPVQIKVRWEERQELFLSDKGEELLSRARVFFDGDIANETYLMLGVSDAPNPAKINEAFKVRAIIRTPNLRGTRVEQKAWL